MIATAVCYPEVALRRATPGDRDLVYAWNSAGDVRALSKDPRPIAPADHARWYAERIALGGAPIWIIVEGGAPVGVVRIDPRPGGAAAISIALAAEVRGRGVGRRAIAIACRAWARPLNAEIRSANTASRLCFEACGFVRAAELAGLTTYHWSP